MTTTQPNIQQIVTERIKAEFVKLLPDDDWAILVENNIAAMQSTRNHYGQPQVSELEQLIRAEITTVIKATLQTELAKPEYWGDSLTPAKFVSDYIAANAADLVKASWAEMVQKGIDRLRYEITEKR